ncbi:MAG: Spy/CpxP family protein refolding chaperone [Leptospiraceae bacterium]|nr:Spy/CpxP family protein refolding chaperone [Leptospiraceae bacterium]
MKKLFKILGVGTLTLILVNFLNCHRGGKNFEDRVNYISKKLESHLDLDDSQKPKMEKIKNEIIAKHKELKAKQNPEAKKEFIAMVRSDKMDKDKLKTIHENRKKSKEEMGNFIMDKMVEFHAILKPEQRNKLADKMEKFMNRHHGID